MSEKVRVRTNLAGTRGSTVSFHGKDVKFDDEGVAEVSKEVGEDLMQSFPNVYYQDGQVAPVRNASQDKVIPNEPDADNFRQKFEEGVEVKSSKLTEEQQKKEDSLNEELEKERAEKRALLERLEALEKGKEAEVKVDEPIKESKTEEEAQGADEKEEKDEVVDEQSKMSEQEQALREELDDLTVPKLKALIEETEKFEEDQYKSLKKGELIDFIVENEIV